MNKGYARKLSSSGIELVCEFLGRTMCNHNQFLLFNFCFRLLILAICLAIFAEVLILTGKSDAYNKLICIVERVHFHVRVGVKNLTKYFSPSFVLRYAAAVFANAVRLLTSCSCVSST